jgi:hypothetical protein
MKIKIRKPKRQEANVLAIALVLTCLLGTILAGALYWGQTQHRLVGESQAWNTSMAIAEAGIEEGMAQINIVLGTNFIPSITTNGWGTAPGGGYGPRTNTLLGGYYSVTISNDFPPSIYSTGYAQAPFGGRYVSRTVKVTTKTVSTFGQAGISVLQDIDMKGNNVMIDSYDSSDPLHSLNGQYNPLTRMAGGNVVSVGGLINVGNADVYGHVWTSPWGSLSVGAGGLVGDLPLNWPTQSGIESGWYTNDYNGSFKDVTVPYSSGLGLAMVNKTYTLSGGDYYYSGTLSLQSGYMLMVAPNTTNRLYVTGGINMQSQNGSWIGVGTNASIQVYVGTTDTTQPVSSSFTQVTNVNAGSFQYYGLPSNNSVSWNGNAYYEGTVYAPEAAFSLGGSGNTTTNDYSGACLVQSLTMNGHFNFHYDQALALKGPLSGFNVASWQEL